MVVTLLVRRVFLLALSVCVGWSAAACGSSTTPTATPTIGPDTWATVDGREIKRDQVETAFRRMRDAGQRLAPEEELTAKLSVLNEIITQEILLAKARDLKVELTDTELDTAYNEAKKNIAPAEFDKELAARSVTAADMREGLRRELLTQKLLEREVGAKASISDQEINEYFNANRAQFNIPEESYHLAQIVVTPVRDQQITNRTGDDASTPQQAAAKTQMLMERLKAGASFQDLAVGYSEDADSAPRGGDVGLVPVSRIRQAPQPMQNAVLNVAPGTVKVASVGGAHTIVLVVAHEKAGQRDPSMPEVRERITNGLKGRKEQLLRAAYLSALQADADVVNYLARQIVANQGKLPGGTTTAATAPTNATPR
jgi:parvulin-like peptidyl-prolyl isomerase